MPLIETAASASAKAFGLNSFVPSTDPYFSHVTFLSGTSAGRANNTIVDSSANNYTVTKYGNVAQGSVNPYMDTYSVNFGGGGVYGVANPSAVNFGTADFTVEFWMRPYIQNSTYSSIGFGGTSGMFLFNLVSPTGELPNQVAINAFGTGPHWTSTTYNFQHKWHHIAYVRESGVGKLYIDGSLHYSAADTVNYTAAGDVRIAGAGTIQIYSGFLSDIRVVKAAVYTANFTPPTSKLENIPNTTLLTLRRNRLIDESSSATPVTLVVGAPRITPFNPYGKVAYDPAIHGGSLVFDGDEDYITIPDNSNLELGSGDFTLEMWAWPRNVFTTGTGAEVYNKNYGIQLYLMNGVWSWYGSTTSSGYDILNALNGGSATINQWQHIALVRSGNVFTSYFNGAVVSTATASGSFENNSDPIYIGRYATGGFPYTGYLTSIRLTKSAVYSSAFTPPTSALAPLANTQLLLNGANSDIYNRAATMNMVSAGTLSASSSVVKYGGTSMGFSGDSSSLKVEPIGNDGALMLLVSDFTLEGWFYFTRLPSSRSDDGAGLIDFRAGTGTSPTGLVLYAKKANDKFVVYSNGDQITSTTSVQNNTWFHVAVTRSGSSVKLFVNGVQEGSTWTSSAKFTDNWFLVSGVTDLIGGSYMKFEGYMDDVRVTNGISRYNSNFVPPVSELSGKR